MSTLYISEFSGIGDQTRIVQAARGHIASQEVAISDASAESSALNSSTTLVRLLADAPCLVAYGIGVAIDDDPAPPTIALAAEAVEYISVPLNSGYRIAVIERELPA